MDGWDWILCRKPQETVTALFSTARDKAPGSLSMPWLRKSALEIGASTPWPQMNQALRSCYFPSMAFHNGGEP